MALDFGAGQMKMGLNFQWLAKVCPGLSDLCGEISKYHYSRTGTKIHVLLPVPKTLQISKGYGNAEVLMLQINA